MRNLLRSGLLVVFVMAFLRNGAAADPLPDDQTQSWKTAGASVCYIAAIGKLGHVCEVMPTESGVDPVPGFDFSGRPRLSSDALPSLSIPRSPFGICLTNVRLGDGGMAWVSGCSGLRVLNLAATDATDDGYAQIGKLAKLRGLNLASTKIGRKGLLAIAGCRDLYSLDLSGAESVGGELKPLAALDQLQWLNLKASNATDADMTGIGDLVSLRFLDLLDTDICDDGIKSLSKLTKLTSLLVSPGKRHAGQRYVTDEACPTLAQLSELISLGLDGSKVTASGVAKLTVLNHLEQLMLSDTAADDKTGQVLSGMTSLESVYLVGTRITDAGIASLAVLPNLQKVYVGSNPGLTDSCLKDFSTFPALTTLNLFFDRNLTDSGFRQIAACRNLVSLDLNGTSLSDDGLASFAALKNLKTLNVRMTRVTGAGIAALKAKRPGIDIRS